MFGCRRIERLRKCRFCPSYRADFTICWRRTRNRIRRGPEATCTIFHRPRTRRRRKRSRRRCPPCRKSSMMKRRTMWRCRVKNRCRMTQGRRHLIFVQNRKISATRDRRASRRNINDQGRRRNRNTVNIVSCNKNVIVAVKSSAIFNTKHRQEFYFVFKFFLLRYIIFIWNPYSGVYYSEGEEYFREHVCFFTEMYIIKIDVIKKDYDAHRIYEIILRSDLVL